MKKILVTEAQFKMLQEKEWQYSSEKIDEILQKAKSDLDKAKRSLSGFHNAITVMTIGEIMDDLERYTQFKDEIEKHQKYYENLYNKYYDIIDMYDFLDQPDNVTELDRINNKIDSIQNDLYSLADSMEEILGYVAKIKEIGPFYETTGDNQ